MFHGHGREEDDRCGQHFETQKKSLQSRGIEPRTSAWKADILPLNYDCDCSLHTNTGGFALCNVSFFLKKTLLQSRGIEPRTSAWKADILPLNYDCDCSLHAL
jgi:hypothetical protein